MAKRIKDTVNYFMTALVLANGLPLKASCEDGCKSPLFLKSIQQETNEKERLKALAIYATIYFSGKHRPNSSLEKKLAEKIRCMEWPTDSAKIKKLQEDFLKAYDPNLTTPENEALETLNKRAKWVKENGHYTKDPKRPFTTFGVDVLLNGIPTTYMPTETGKVEATFPNGIRRTYQPNSNWRIEVKNEKTRSEILRQNLFIPKGHKSLEEALTFNTQLLPCPDLSQSKQNYFEKEWNHLRFFTDFVINTKRLKKKNGIYNLEGIFTVSKGKELINQDTITLNQNLPEKGMIRFAPNRSFPDSQEDYLITAVFTDLNSGKKAEYMKKTQPSPSPWLCGPNYLQTKNTIPDYYFPASSGRTSVQKGDNIAVALKNIPIDPTTGKRKIIQTIYFNPEKESQTEITTSPDSTLWNGPKQDNTNNSQKRPSNLISQDTIYVQHRNAYLATPIDTSINKKGNFVVTYKSKDRIIGSGFLNLKK